MQAPSKGSTFRLTLIDDCSPLTTTYGSGLDARLTEDVVLPKEFKLHRVEVGVRLVILMLR
jgi:hypothetical protein